VSTSKSETNHLPAVEMQKQEGSMSSDQQASLKQITYPREMQSKKAQMSSDQQASLKQITYHLGDAEARRLK